MHGVIAAAGPQSGLSLSAAQAIVGVISALGLGSIIAAIVSGLFTRKKLGADATEIITKAASGVVENLNADNARLRGEHTEMRAEVDAERAARQKLEDEFERVVGAAVRVLQLHAAWDHLVVEKMNSLGITMPEPPPLYPPDASPGDFLRD